MKKQYVFLLIVLVIIAVVVVLISINKKPEDTIIQSAYVQKFDDPLIKETKSVGELSFEECNITNVNGKLKLKVTVNNTTSEIFMAKAVSITLLDSNSSSLETKESKKLLIAPKRNTVVEIEFDGSYTDIKDVKYLIIK